MIDVKACLAEAQEKMDEAVMYLDGAHWRTSAPGKADIRFAGRHPCGLLRYHGTYQ